MIVIKDLLTNDVYVDHGENSYGEKIYRPLSEDWEWYHQLGILPEILSGMKRLGLEVPIISNKWEYSQSSWKFMPTGHNYDPLAERIIVEGEPGTEPSPAQKEEVQQRIALREQERLEADEHEQRKRQQKRELLDKALEHIIGATVIEFGPPQYDEDDHESGYLVVRTAQGMEIIITSTHSVWDYGDSSNDNLWLSIRESSS